MYNYATCDNSILSHSESNWTQPNQTIVFLIKAGSQIIGFDWLWRNNTNTSEKVETRELEQTTKVYIERYKAGDYEIIKPLTISIESLADDEFVATFDEAEVSISDSSVSEVIAALKREIIEVYKLFKCAEKLGPRPKRQLSILEKHIAKKSG